MYDITIIGAGPAGLSAAVNIWARNKSALILGTKPETSAIWKAEKINNHLGMRDLSGEQLMNDFIEHVNSLKIEKKTGRVLQILKSDNHFYINFENDIIESKIIILSTGLSKKSNIKGEADFVGKGVSYCATCDGMLYRGRNVLVYSELEEGVEDANFLSEICSKVWFMSPNDCTKGLNPKVEIIQGKIDEIVGTEFVESVKIKNNNLINVLEDIEGVFFIKASSPPSSIIPEIEIVNNHILVNDKMQTNIDGVFACGDVVGLPYQVSKAIGEGLIAGQNAVKALNNYAL